MDAIVSRFFDHGGQIVALASVLIVWLGLTGLGALIGGRDRIDAADGFLGWFAVCAIFTVAGVFTGVGFDILALVLGVVGVGGLVVAKRRDGRVLAHGFVPILLLTSPLLLAASAMVGSQWDEFSHWLPAIRFLIEGGAFPTAATRDFGGTFPAYPAGWVFLPYLAGSLTGRVIESAGGLFNLILLLSFGLMLVRTVRTVIGDPSPGAHAGLGILALAALAVTILNPTFVQKVVLTSYADTATAVCLGAAALLACAALSAESQGDGTRAIHRMMHSAMVLAIVVTLKQATLVLFVLLISGIAVAGLVDRTVGFRRTVLLTLVLAVPGLILHAVWRFYVASELPGGEMTLPPFDRWLVDVVPAVIGRMIVVLSNKGAYLATMVIASAFAVRALFGCRTLFDRLAIVSATVFLGYNAFLCLAYITVLGGTESQALQVLSLWRYNMHVGGLAVAFLAVGAAMLWRRHMAHRSIPRWVSIVPVALLLILPVALSKKIRFDREPDKPHFRTVAEAVRDAVPADGRIIVIDPRGTGESGLITRYHVHGKSKLVAYIGSGQAADAFSVANSIAAVRADHAVVHSSSAGIEAVFGLPFAARTSYLLAQDSTGRWMATESWPYAPDRR